MRLIRTSVLALIVGTVGASAAMATDFYIKPVKNGPVAAPAVAALTAPGVSVTGNTSGSSTSPTTSTTVGRTTTTSSAAGKWVKVGDGAATSAAKTAAATTQLASTQTSAAPAAAQTFNSVTALLSSGKLASGDRVFLMDGYHGPITIRGERFSAPVLFAPLPGSNAQVDSIVVDNSTNIVFQNLKVWAMSANAGKAPLVRTYPNTSDLIFTNLDVRSVYDSPNYKGWAKTTWAANRRGGFLVDGTRITLRGNRITGVQNGIIGIGDYLLMENNAVDGFSADGLRALGDNSIVRGNLVQNCVAIDSTHHDGFQSYSTGPGGKPGTGTQKNLTIENNRIFESVGGVGPLACQLQGIGLFDGMYDGLKIENNVIVVSAYHGIAIAGALNTMIRQNTVVAASGQNAKFPWIKVSNHKKGTKSQNVTIVNNLASNITTTANPAQNIVVANNAKAGPASSEFNSFSAFDLSLKSGSKGVDAGDAKLTTASDVLGIKRWLGKAPDAGAYESH